MMRIEGVITPVISPFLNNNIDYDSISKLVEFLHKSGVDGIFPMGSTGGFPIISMENHLKIMKYYADARKENMLFMAGVGRGSFDETLTVANFSKDLGIDALVVVTPYYIQMNQSSLRNYFEKILDIIDSPIILYNIPQLTGNNIHPETVLSLAEQHSNLIGLKESSGNFSQFLNHLELLPKNLAIFQGQDELLLPSLMAGAAGGICGTSNFTDLAAKVFKSFKNREHEEAKKYHSYIVRMKSMLSIFPFPQAYSYLFFKNVIGLDETEAPFPLSDMSEDEKRNLNQQFTRIFESLKK